MNLSDFHIKINDSDYHALIKGWRNNCRAVRLSQFCDEQYYTENKYVKMWQFLPRDAMLAQYMLSSCVNLYVRLTQARTVPKRLNIASRKYRHAVETLVLRKT